MNQVKIIGNHTFNCTGCTLRDQIEIWAMRGNLIEITYWEGKDEKSISSCLKDIKIFNKAEYLVLLSGQEIAFEKLISMEEINQTK